MNIRLERTARVDGHLRGTLTVDGERWCDTLESLYTDGRIGSAILPGEYWLRLTSHGGDRLVPRLFRVPNGAGGEKQPSRSNAESLGDFRENIRVLDGVTPDGDGSIILVPSDADPDSDASRDLLDRLVRGVQEALGTREGALVTIVALPGEAQTVVLPEGIDITEQIGTRSRS